LNQSSKNIVMWLLMIVTVVLIFNLYQKQDTKNIEITYSEFIQAVDQGKVSKIVIKQDLVDGQYTDTSSDGAGKFLTHIPANSEKLLEKISEKNVSIDIQPKEDDSFLMMLFINTFPILLLIGLWIFFMRQMQGAGGKAMSFGKSKARLIEEGDTKVTFANVAGIDEAKKELEIVVQFLKDPKKFTKLGGRIPKGVLLVGGPGTGKTLLAKAIAGEAGVPFFSISGSDFVEMFVGVGASRVRDLFMKGKKNAPCIIFIDEIDAVGRQRGAGLGGGHDEREQTLNQLLVEMDGFEANEGVVLIAATNRPDVLDPALLRPGRFDRRVIVPLPDLKGRQEILLVHTKKVKIVEGLSLEVIARGTPGFSGADIENLVNEAAIHAASLDAPNVTMEHFEHAKDKILMGAERRSMVISEDEKAITAYHEAGHAIIAKLVPNADPVHKVTIVPRGVALGLMQQLPEDEKHNFPKEYWLDRICIAFGGRVAEEIKFNQITTGASSDIKAATSIAKRMVCEWGMSEKAGPLAYDQQGESVFLGREISQSKDYSEQTASLIDSEVKAIIDEQLTRARKIISENGEVLEKVAQALLEKETLDSNQVSELMGKTPTNKDSVASVGLEVALEILGGV
jgi:cell division protease FtsH